VATVKDPVAILAILGSQRRRQRNAINSGKRKRMREGEDKEGRGARDLNSPEVAYLSPRSLLMIRQVHMPIQDWQQAASWP
jgi:hypothetical protein